jgi:hypothetical protein
MAAIIIGSGNVTEGLAPGAKLIPVRVTNGETASPDAMAAGIRYAIAQHANVINISQRVLTNDTNLASAVQAAISANIVIVAASGDEAQSSVDYPAAYPGVVAVGAVDQSKGIWSSSNTGPQVTLAAPGVSVPTENNFGSAATTDGTSASTAYVSAAVALIRAAHPSWTAGQVIRDLIATADPASGEAAGQHSDQYGYGIVDPLKALQASAPTQTSNPLLGSANGASASASAAPSAGATGGTAPAASSKSSTGLIIGIVVAVIVVILIIVLIVSLNRRNRNRPGGPGWPGGPGAGGPAGGQRQPYGQFPQQSPYPQQQNPYPQQNPYQQSPPPQQQYPYPPQNPQQPPSQR